MPELEGDELPPHAPEGPDLLKTAAESSIGEVGDQLPLVQLDLNGVCPSMSLSAADAQQSTGQARMTLKPHDGPRGNPLSENVRPIVQIVFARNDDKKCPVLVVDVSSISGNMYSVSSTFRCRDDTEISHRVRVGRAPAERTSFVGRVCALEKILRGYA